MKVISSGLGILIIGMLAMLFVRNRTTSISAQTMSPSKEQYQCLPCGNDCDVSVYDQPGNCPHCGMALVKRSSIKFGSIVPSEICSYIKAHPNVVLLDVRTKDEYQGKTNPDYGTIQNAINIPLQELKSRIGELDSLKSRTVIVYCSHSHRSPQASYLLSQNGFQHVMNMNGGMSVFKDNNCKIVR